MSKKKPNSSQQFRITCCNDRGRSGAAAAVDEDVADKDAAARAAAKDAAAAATAMDMATAAAVSVAGAAPVDMACAAMDVAGAAFVGVAGVAAVNQTGPAAMGFCGFACCCCGE